MRTGNQGQPELHSVLTSPFRTWSQPLMKLAELIRAVRFRLACFLNYFTWWDLSGTFFVGVVSLRKECLSKIQWFKILL